MRITLAAALFCLATLPAHSQLACGDPAIDCPTASGSYRLALPAQAAGPVPALVFLHGWGGSSAGVMKNRAMLATLRARGYALIAPEGIPTSANRSQKNWAVRDGRDYARDEVVSAHAEDRPLESRCEFCNASYSFDVEELDALLGGETVH